VREDPHGEILVQLIEQLPQLGVLLGDRAMLFG
jgi:hypothetical protein